MDQAAITFLENPECRRVAAAWTSVNVADLVGDDLVNALAEASGVSRWKTRRIVPVLLSNDICRSDGTLDEYARALIVRATMDSMTRTASGRSPKPSKRQETEHREA